MSAIELWTKILNKTRGRFFTVDFTKNDGSFRRLNGKTGRVTIENLMNGTYLCVWDAQNRGFRYVNVLTIKALRCKELSL